MSLENNLASIAKSLELIAAAAKDGAQIAGTDRSTIEGAEEQ